MTTPTEEPRRPGKAKDVFLDLLELPREQRAVELERRTPDDPAMRAAVQSLLDANDRAEGFLAGPTVGDSSVARATDSGDIPHRQIGPYRLLQVIGEGGFGTVYMAEQESPVRRRVALKVIKLGMDTRQVVARFEAERQALAIMDHPNIARVFDAGATEQGRPFFVMELVKGDPITNYCDANRLTPRQRLELFIPVCQAVQHAHQKGVIHRDIKPSNVLVTLHDGKPVPKVIDFGIAKATQSKLTEKTLFTEFRQMIGTPEYMSPEQAEMSGLDIDTRSDIYSLGVLLYELLTGTTPFDARDLRSKAYAEIQRVIREVDPPKPSTRIESMRDTIGSVAAQRNTEPRRLGTLVRGELDWIVMKCLEKDRTRRYETASNLAADVQNYLVDAPVTAASPSAAYRMSKFVRRHKLGMGVAASIFVALLVGLILALWGFDRARKSERLAQQRLEQVSVEAAKSQAVSNFLSGAIAEADPFRAESNDPTVRQMLDSAAAKIDAGFFRGQPEIEAAVRTTIGRALQSLGRPEASVAQLRRALEIRRRTATGDDAEVATLLNLIGVALADQHQIDEAERTTREALEMRRRVHGPQSREVAETLGNLASVALERGDLAEAEQLYRESAAIDAKLGPGSLDESTRMSNLALVLARQGKFEESEQTYRQLMDVETRTVGADHPSRAITLGNFASLLLRQGKFNDAEAPAREALRVAQKSLPPNHPDVAVALNGLGHALMGQGKLDEAEPLMRQAVTVERAARGANHPELASALRNHAAVLARLGRWGEAEPLLLESLEIMRAAAGPAHPGTADIQGRLGQAQLNLARHADAERNLRQAFESLRASPDVSPDDKARAEAQLAAALVQLDRLDEAEPLFAHALDVLRRSGGPGDALRAALLNYWDLPLKRNRLDEAEAVSRELLKLCTDQRGPDHPDTALAQTRLAYVLARRNAKLDEAEQITRAALATRQKLPLPPQGWILQVTRSLLGEILLKQGRLDEAAPLISESHELILKDPSTFPTARADAVNRLILLYEKQGKPDEAAKLRNAPATAAPTQP